MNKKSSQLIRTHLPHALFSQLTIWLSFICAIFSTFASQAQGDLDLSIEILPPYPIQIEYYVNNADNAFVTLTNMGGTDKNIYLHAAIIGDNGLMASTKDGFRPAGFVTVPAFQTLFLTGSDLAAVDMGFNSIGNLDIVGVTPEIQDLIYIQRVLPAGSYRVCIRALSWDTNLPYAQGCSSEFTIYDASTPLIYLPLDGEMLEPNIMSNVQFAWWPPFTGAAAQPNFVYRLRMIDITDGEYDDLDLEMNNPGRRLIIDRDFIQEDFFLFDVNSAAIGLDTGGLYAVRVQARDLTNQVPIENNGNSEVITFRYGEIQELEEEDTGSANPCDGYCEFQLPENQSPTGSISGMQTLKIGYFEIEDLVISNPSGASASGTGKIAIPFMDSVKINVQFNGVQVNGNGRIFDGEVHAITDYDYDPNNPASISSWNQFVRTERLISTLLGGRGRSLNLPLGYTYNLSGENFMLGFTQATFKHDRASCQFMHALNAQSWGDYFISLSASDICILPDGFGQEFVMHPPADTPLPELFGCEWFLKGSVSTDSETIRQESTYLSVDCQGISAFGLNLEAFFPNDMLIPKNSGASPTTDRVKATVRAHIPRQTDSPSMGSGEPMKWGFIAQVEMDDFSLYGFPDLTFEVNDAWLDISDTLNPKDILVPATYQGPHVENTTDGITLDAAWEGFYLRSMRMSSRDDWPLDGIKIDANVEHFIYDGLVSGNFYLQDLAATDHPSYDFSIDTFYAELVQWSFAGTGSWEVGLNGRVGIPLTSADDDFRYSTVILPHDGTGETDLEIIIQSPGGLTFPVMGNASAQLCPNSYIRLAKVNGEQILDTHLAGNMSINIPSPVSFSIPWVDFHIGYHSLDGISHDAFSIMGQNISGEAICANVPEVVSIAGTAGHSGTGSGTSSSSGANGTGSGSSGGGSGSSGTGGSGSDGSGHSGSTGSGSGGPGAGTSGGTSEATSSSAPGVAGTPTSGTGAPLPPPPGSSDVMGMNNFPIELKELKLKQVSNGSINFDINPSVDILGGGENGLGAEVDFSIQTYKNASSKKFELGPNAFDIGSIHLNKVNTFGLSLDGYVDFYNEQHAKGARGNLEVNLPLGLELELSADFGVVVEDPNVAFGSSNQYYGYWYVDGMIGFAKGIPLAPGVGLHGLGGGVYVNMERPGPSSAGNNDPQVQMEVNNILGSIQVNGNASKLPDTYRPVPKFGTYGVKLATRLATTVPSALNMDVNISGTFAQNLGINSLSINGEAYVMSPLDKREKSNLWAFAGLHWSKQGKHDHQFNGNIALYANVAGGVLRGAGAGDKVVDVSFEANTASGKWFFKAGQPNDRAGLKVDLVLANLNANGYFMFGHDMPTTLPVPAQVERILGNASSNSKDGNRLDNQQSFRGGARPRSQHSPDFYENGEGIAFGLEANVGFDLRAWALYATLNAYLGFDINLTRLAGATCYVPSQGQISPGINDWYATGQIYAGFEGAMGLKGRFLGKEYNWELFAMGAAMIIQAGGPNPTWAEGRAGVYYRLLNGALKGHANFDLSVGQKCIPTNDDSGMIPIVYKLTPEDGETDVSIFESRRLMATFYVPINEDIVIPHIEFGKTINRTVNIYIDDFKVKSANGTFGLNDMTQTWSNDKKAVTFNISSVFLSKTDYEMELKMKANEKIGSQYVPYRLSLGGPIWPGEKHTHEFRTGEAPYPIPDSEILATIPIRRQRFFMREEMNAIYKAVAPVITFRMDMKSLGQSDYFPASTENLRYTYYLRWQDTNGGEPIIQLKNYGEASSVQFVTSNIPNLLPSTIYSCQLIRKTERIFTRQGLNGETIALPLSNNNLQILDQSFSSEAALGDITLNRADTLTADIMLDPGLYTAPGEDIIYQFYFRTSKHNTLAEKMAVATTSYENVNHALSDYPKVVFTMDERFDVFDVLGYFNSEAPFNRLIAPRVHIRSELNGNPSYYFSQNPPEIYTQNAYGVGTGAVPILGQNSYNSYLNQSLIGFVHLHQELSATSHTVQAHKISGPRESPITLINQTLPSLNSTISKDYTAETISFSLGEAEIEGFLGPLADQNIQNAINNHAQSHSGPGLGAISDPLGLHLIPENVASFSTFKVAYKMPVWVVEDINKAVASGNDIFSRTTTRGSIYIPPNDTPIGGGNPGDIEIGGSNPPIILGTGGPNTQSIDEIFWSTNMDALFNTNYGDLTTYNIWSHYLDTYYPAFRMQLDNMGLNARRMQEHGGTYRIIVTPDRGWIPMSLPTTSAQNVINFSYNQNLWGSGGGGGGSIGIGSSGNGGSAGSGGAGGGKFSSGNCTGIGPLIRIGVN